jgi:uncharacterized membrane protein YdbT with pleckstrin-like domain
MIKIESDEKIKTLLRRHWLILIMELMLVFILILAAFFGYNYLKNLAPESSFFLEITGILKQFLALALIIFLMILWIFAFSKVVDYYLDVWIITDRRVIDIEQHGLFHREISEFYLARIQDVTVSIKGFIATVFEFGDIHIQTAGEHREFVFKQVPNPHEAKTLILKLAQKAPQTNDD